MDSTDTPIHYLDSSALTDLYRTGQLSPVEVLAQVMTRIEKLNVRLNAFRTLSRQAYRDARFSEERWLKAEPRSALDGVPISIKDLIVTSQMPTSAGSRVFGEGIYSRRDATLVARLRRAGAILLGKTHLHEFAYGVTNENAHFGPARNPWDTNRITGGSSGGSAAAVAAGLGVASIGTDTRGSIRIPSAFCGVCGLKPTRKRVPTRGVIPLSSTLDHAGPIARTTADVERVYQVIAARNNEGEQRHPDSPPHIGICDYYWSRLDAQVAEPLQRALKLLEEAGARLTPVRVRWLDEACGISGLIAASEAYAYHSPLIAARRDYYDPAVVERLVQGARIQAWRLVDAYRIRSLVRGEFRRVFREVDCLVGACLPALPPPIGQGFLHIDGSRAETLSELVRFNAPQNVAGVPALVLPCGFSQEGLPVGLQFIAGEGCESMLLKLGRRFESLGEWHLQRPSLAAAAKPTAKLSP